MSAQMDPSFFGVHENLILTRQGAWLSNGEEITHPGTLLGFARHLFRTPDGFEIRIGAEAKVVHVEDTIYFVTSLAGEPETGFHLHLNDGRELALDPHSLRYRPGRLTCMVSHPNEGTQEEAKFLSSSYYEILKHLEKDSLGFRLFIAGKYYLIANS